MKAWMWALLLRSLQGCHVRWYGSYMQQEAQLTGTGGCAHTPWSHRKVPFPNWRAAALGTCKEAKLLCWLPLSIVFGWPWPDRKRRSSTVSLRPDAGACADRGSGSDHLSLVPALAKFCVSLQEVAGLSFQWDVTRALQGSQLSVSEVQEKIWEQTYSGLYTEIKYLQDR